MYVSFSCSLPEAAQSFSSMDSQPIRDTLAKVDQALARIQDIQLTIADGSRVCRGISLSPRSTRGYLRTSLRCKQESLRMKDLAMNSQNDTPLGSLSSLRRSTSLGEGWRRWSMSAMMIQHTLGEIVEATNIAKEAAYTVMNSNESNPMAYSETTNYKKISDSFRTLCKTFPYLEHENESESPGLGNKMHDSKDSNNCSSYSMKLVRKLEKEKKLHEARQRSPDRGAKVKKHMTFGAMLSDVGFSSPDLVHETESETVSAKKWRMLRSFSCRTPLSFSHKYYDHGSISSPFPTMLPQSSVKTLLGSSSVARAAKMMKKFSRSSLFSKTAKKIQVIERFSKPFATRPILRHRKKKQSEQTLHMSRNFKNVSCSEPSNGQSPIKGKRFYGLLPFPKIKLKGKSCDSDGIES